MPLASSATPQQLQQKAKQNRRASASGQILRRSPSHTSRSSNKATSTTRRRRSLSSTAEEEHQPVLTSTPQPTQQRKKQPQHPLYSPERYFQSKAMNTEVLSNSASPVALQEQERNAAQQRAEAAFEYQGNDSAADVSVLDLTTDDETPFDKNALIVEKKKKPRRSKKPARGVHRSASLGAEMTNSSATSPRVRRSKKNSEHSVSSAVTSPTVARTHVTQVTSTSAPTRVTTSSPPTRSPSRRPKKDRPVGSPKREKKTKPPQQYSTEEAVYGRATSDSKLHALLSSPSNHSHRHKNSSSATYAPSSSTTYRQLTRSVDSSQKQMPRITKANGVTVDAMELPDLNPHQFLNASLPALPVDNLPQSSQRNFQAEGRHSTHSPSRRPDERSKSAPRRIRSADDDQTSPHPAEALWSYFGAQANVKQSMERDTTHTTALYQAAVAGVPLRKQDEKESVWQGRERAKEEEKVEITPPAPPQLPSDSNRDIVWQGSERVQEEMEASLDLARVAPWADSIDEKTAERPGRSPGRMQRRLSRSLSPFRRAWRRNDGSGNDSQQDMNASSPTLVVQPYKAEPENDKVQKSPTTLENNNSYSVPDSPGSHIGDRIKRFFGGNSSAKLSPSSESPRGRSKSRSDKSMPKREDINDLPSLDRTPRNIPTIDPETSPQSSRETKPDPVADSVEASFNDSKSSTLWVSKVATQPTAPPAVSTGRKSPITPEKIFSVLSKIQESPKKPSSNSKTKVSTSSETQQFQPIQDDVKAVDHEEEEDDEIVSLPEKVETSESTNELVENGEAHYNDKAVEPPPSSGMNGAHAPPEVSQDKANAVPELEPMPVVKDAGPQEPDGMEPENHNSMVMNSESFAELNLSGRSTTSTQSAFMTDEERFVEELLRKLDKEIGAIQQTLLDKEEEKRQLLERQKLLKAERTRRQEERKGRREVGGQTRKGRLQRGNSM